MKFFHNSTSAFAVFFILFFTSCKNNNLDIDVSDIDVKLNIHRFEEDLFENKFNDYQGFSSKYPAFINDYNLAILGFQGTPQEAFGQLMLFKTDPNAKKMYELVHAKFHDFTPYEKELTKAYQHFKYYFPSVNIPDIVTYTSNFSFYMNPVGENYIGIALDMHMGQDFAPYKYTNIENYWKKILIPESIVTNHMLAHANDLFAKSNLNNNFIDEIIYQGKLLYFLDATTPWVEDHVKIGMTKAELDWCKKEEHNIWAFFVKEKYLYETDHKKFDRLIKEGPKTIANGVPQDAPAMIGKYAGWMAVRQYMKEFSDVTLSELMNDGNARDILQKGGYKP
jgi:hypothetical protein